MLRCHYADAACYDAVSRRHIIAIADAAVMIIRFSLMSFSHMPFSPISMTPIITL